MIELSQRTTPIGEVRIAARAGQLVGLAFVDGSPRVERQLQRRFPTDQLREGKCPSEASGLLARYMAGDSSVLADLVVDPGGTG